MKKPLSKLLLGVALFAATAIAQGADLWSVYQIAVDRDPQLAAAAAGFRAVQEVRPQSRAALLPQLNAGANWSRIHTDVEESTIPGAEGTESYNASGYELTLNQEVFRHESWVQLDQADTRISQAEAEYGAAEQALALRVSAAYFSVLAASDALEFAQAEQKATEQQLRQTEQRFEVGLSAITDVHEARAGYDAAVAQEIAARNQLDIARESLREITGQSFAELRPLAEEIPLVTPEPENIDTWVDTAQDRNLELLAAAAAAKLAGQEIERRKGGHYPSVDLQAQHAYSDTSDRPGFGTKATDNTLMLNLNVPIYQGGLVSSQLREAHELHNQARDLLEERRRATISQARQAYLNVSAGISQVRARRQALESAQTALEATQAGFEVGTRTAVDVLNSQRELFGAQRDHAQARYDYILATLNLKLAAGILSADDIQAVNAWLD